MSRREAAIRVALVAALLLAVALNTPTWIAAPIGLLSVLAAGELAIRPYGRTFIDRVVLGTGATLTVLVLTGLTLNATPWGLTRATWVVAMAVLSLVVLFVRRDQSTAPTVPRVPNRSSTVWGGASLLVLGFAIALSIAGSHALSASPSLAFALQSSTGTSVTVSIDNVGSAGNFVIRAMSGDPGHDTVSSPAFSIEPGTSIEKTVTLSQPGRWTLDLIPEDGRDPIRSLVVDVGA